MFKIFYAEKDTTLYEQSPAYNYGLDELLEIGKHLDDEGSTYLKSRSVLKFDMTEVSASLSKYGKTVNDCKFMLQLYTSHAKNLSSDYDICAYKLAQAHYTLLEAGVADLGCSNQHLLVLHRA